MAIYSQNTMFQLKINDYDCLVEQSEILTENDCHLSYNGKMTFQSERILYEIQVID